MSDFIALSTAVMAHPSRVDAAAGLAAVLGPATKVVIDDGGGEWATGARAWQAHEPRCTHHLVVQDDAVPCRDLAPGVASALRRVPGGDLMSLYFGYSGQRSGRPSGHGLTVRGQGQARRVGASWIVGPGVWWGVALVIPTGAIGDMLAWCDGRREPYDMRIGTWCRATGRDVWHTWPSLVDHTDGPSLVRPGRAPGRKAWQFVGGDASALGFDRDGPVIRLGTNNRPSSVPSGGWVRSALRSRRAAREGRMDEDTDPPTGLHDPQRRRSRSLATYLQRRRQQRADQELSPGILPPPMPPPAPEPGPAPAGPAPAPVHSSTTEPGPGLAAEAPGSGTVAPPPVRGRGSSADRWREYLVQLGHDRAALDGLTQPQLVELYRGNDGGGDEDSPHDGGEPVVEG